MGESVCLLNGNVGDVEGINRASLLCQPYAISALAVGDGQDLAWFQQVTLAQQIGVGRLAKKEFWGVESTIPDLAGLIKAAFEPVGGGGHC